MDTRVDQDVEANTVVESTTEENTLVPLPPEWLLILVAFLSPPPGDNTEPGFTVKSLWWAYRSVRKVLVRLPLAIARVVRDGYYKPEDMLKCKVYLLFLVWT